MNDLMDELNKLYREVLHCRAIRIEAAESLRVAEQRELRAIEKLRVATELANRRPLLATLSQQESCETV